MSVIGQLADFVNGSEFTRLSQDTVEHLKMHLLDTIGAMLVGSQTPAGEAIGKVLGNLKAHGNIPAVGYSVRTSLLPSIMVGCAGARCTEVDDIHLPSCTTPGSVIIPSALSLASAGYLSDPEDFLTAVAVGYDMLIRLGMAIDGPRILYKGVWPTLFGAALGTAAMAAKALRLTSQQVISATLAALSMSTGVVGRLRGDLSTRWLLLGTAAQNGVIAAFLAKEGFSGNDALLEGNSVRINGIRISMRKLADRLGKKFFIDETSMKPYAIARQAISAVEAFREIIATNRVEPDSIQEVSVWVPPSFMAIINHPEFPRNRIESVVSIQYQMALAAYSPQALLDVKRNRLLKNTLLSTFIQKVNVQPSEELELYYPSVWPARVEVKTGSQSYSQSMLYPKGDTGNRLSWDEVASKFNRLTKPTLSNNAADEVVSLARNLDQNDSLVHLLKQLS
ncbi:MmgE/PrpD family protein [Chloroflexota bacterium]